MAVHNHTREDRIVTFHRQGADVPVRQARYRCSCGFATHWSQDAWRAQRAIDRHALDGQLSAW